MEEKLKRESRVFLEKLFKKHDTLNSGSISVDSMRVIMNAVIPDFQSQEELEEVMPKHLKVTKYTVLNKQTNQFEVKLHERAIDFPSAQYICVYFLKKLEKKNSNPFSGKGLIRFDDFPKAPAQIENRDAEHKRRMY